LIEFKKLLTDKIDSKPIFKKKKSNN